jgi:putative SOS response-associated peptidase YedK
MCGRYTLTSQEGLVEDLQLAIGEPADSDDKPAWWRPRWNIAPTQPAPIVANREGPRAIELARWGLVPPWAKSLAEGARMINARAETAADKRAFRDALARRRCLVPADGFFEWRKGGPKGKTRTPFWIHPDPRHAIAFAGVWERWKSPEGVWVISFSILTTDANPLVAPLHDRMPVVLPPSAYARWLDPAAIDPHSFAELFRPAPVDGWSVTEVSPRVNKPDCDEPACVEPAAATPAPPQGTLF